MSATSGKRGPKSKRAAADYKFEDLDGTEWLMRLIIGAAISGAAIRVGLSRDGGALAIGVYVGDEYGTEYVRPADNLAQEVREISMAWNIPTAHWDDTAGLWLIDR